MDKGTNARKMLENEEIHLRLGFYAVKNRSQEDIDNKKSVEDMRRDEKKFFAAHPVYSSMDQNLLGTQSLTNKLTKVLFRHIKEHLPDILNDINAKINKAKEKLLSLGTSLPEDKVGKAVMLQNLISDFCQSFSEAIKGVSN